MLRHDPPRPTEYQDIKIAKEGDSDTIAQVSQTLNTVTSSDLFDFIIQQADRLGASDIHIEKWSAITFVYVCVWMVRCIR